MKVFVLRWLHTLGRPKISIVTFTGLTHVVATAMRCCCCLCLPVAVVIAAAVHCCCYFLLFHCCCFLCCFRFLFCFTVPVAAVTNVPSVDDFDVTFNAVEAIAPVAFLLLLLFQYLTLYSVTAEAAIIFVVVSAVVITSFVAY